VILVTEAGTIVAIHAGWRGLAAGVIDVGVGALVDSTSGSTSDSTSVVAAVLGPTIRPCCYEFGWSDLLAVADGTGLEPAAIAAVSGTGRSALDVPATIGAAMARSDIEVESTAPCTCCSGQFFSHRRGDLGRHAVVAWIDAGPPGVGR
jgi:copper oxidase (laccase) domain-containing protein